MVATFQCGRSVPVCFRARHLAGVLLQTERASAAYPVAVAGVEVRARRPLDSIKRSKIALSYFDECVDVLAAHRPPTVRTRSSGVTGFAMYRWNPAATMSIV
jgi:hypothetical protein